MNQVNRIIVKKVDFPNNFWEKVSTQIQMLIETGHVIRVFFDKNAQELLLDYEILDFSQAVSFPYFLYPGELLAAAHAHKETVKHELEKVLNDDDDEDLLDDILKKDKKNMA